jgi:hypothetical protein
MTSVDTELPQPGGPQTRPNAPAEGTAWPGQVPSGPGVGAPSSLPPVAPDTGLPPGVHPADPSVGDDNPSVPAPSPRATPKTGKPPFSTDSGDAFPVFMRSATDWNAGVVVANAATNGGVATVVGRQKGRISVKVWIPTTLSDGTTPLPALFGSDENELQGPARSPVLNVGDAITIESEGSIYIGVVPGNQTATVQYLVLSNPPGGALGD